MRRKLIYILAINFSLILILATLLINFAGLGAKLLIIGGVLSLSAIFTILILKHNKKSGVNQNNAARSKVIDDNIDWLRQRWDRIQAEKNSGVLKSVSNWYFDDATAQQLLQIEQLGFNLSNEKISKGQASDIIGLFEPAETKNMTILKNHNVPLNGINQTKARELVLNIRKNMVESTTGIIHITEHLIIKQLEDEFIYFVRFFDSRVRHNNPSPQYVTRNNRLRIRYEQAAHLGLARKGAEIPIEERLETLQLEKLSSLAGGQKFSSKDSAIKIIIEIPDIVKRFESAAPLENWFHLKKVKLDVEYLESKWSNLRDNDFCHYSTADPA